MSKVKTPRADEMQARTDRGFTLIEVLISILITAIVMAAVFALLTRGQRSFDREPEVADLQQSARNALELVGKDVLQAGAGLPPEISPFTAASVDSNPDVLELIGAVQDSSGMVMEPEDVFSVVGDIVTMVGPTSNLLPNDIVVISNNTPISPNPAIPQPTWVVATVLNVTAGAQAAVQVLYNYPQYNPAGFIAADVIPLDGVSQPTMTRVSIVRFDTVLAPAAQFATDPPLILQRTVLSNFATGPTTQPVGFVDDFQIQYTTGTAAPNTTDTPPVILLGVPLVVENMLSSVGISVTGRSIAAGLEGSTEGAGAGSSDDFIRKTFSTNVNPRNISSGLSARVIGGWAQ